MLVTANGEEQCQQANDKKRLINYVRPPSHRGKREDGRKKSTNKINKERKKEKTKKERK